MDAAAAGNGGVSIGWSRFRGNRIDSKMGISAENLIGAIARQDNLETGVPSYAAQEKFRDAVRIDTQRFTMPDGGLEVVDQISL